MFDIDNYVEVIKSMQHPGDLGQIEYAAIKFGGEVGEVLNDIGKALHSSFDEHIIDIEEELGDAMYYWARICIALKLDPTEILTKNVWKAIRRKNIQDVSTLPIFPY